MNKNNILLPNFGKFLILNYFKKLNKIIIYLLIILLNKKGNLYFRSDYKFNFIFKINHKLIPIFA